MDDTWRAWLPRLTVTPFAVLATHGPGGRLDLVPCCFALLGGGGTDADGVELVTVVDHKPKRHQRLARLGNIGTNPNVTLLLDHRDPDNWDALWWFRVQGTARVVEVGDDHRLAVDALVAKYPQYQRQRPAGPAIRITPSRWAGWSA